MLIFLCRDKSKNWEVTADKYLVHLTTSTALIAGDDLQPPLSLCGPFGQPLQTGPERLRRHRAAKVPRRLGLTKKRSSRLLALVAQHTHALQPFFQQLQETHHGRYVGQKPPAAPDKVAQL